MIGIPNHPDGIDISQGEGMAGGGDFLGIDDDGSVDGSATDSDAAFFLAAARSLDTGVAVAGTAASPSTLAALSSTASTASSALGACLRVRPLAGDEA
jgi:hypothetical protein